MNKFDFGLIGLGVMGRNFIMNVSEKGFSSLGYDLDKEKVNILNKDAEHLKVKGVNSLDEFISGLNVPRKVMLLVPAGVVDAVIKELTPILDSGDLIIDGGNSHPWDTEKRMKAAEEKGLKYLGVGVSGGAEGARRGPSMMPGGSRESYNLIKEIFEAAAAKVDNEPCVTYLGKQSAGHFVKMVHNGIEYGIMQLISEVYDIMKRGLAMSNEEMHSVFKTWNNGKLESFLVKITTEILVKKDDKEDGYLVDHILDMARQKGTGKWTSQVAMDLQVPVPSIDIAVAMRHMSAFKKEREEGKEVLIGPENKINERKEVVIEKLENALYFSMLVTYAQGMEMLRVASAEKEFDLHLNDVARIWRGGCIIRAALLNDLLKTFKKNPSLENILLDPELAGTADRNEPDTRSVINYASEAGIPVPGLMSALGYFDAYRSGWLPDNLIQAQRDYFGSHTYERVDRDGVFHTEW